MRAPSFCVLCVYALATASFGILVRLYVFLHGFYHERFDVIDDSYDYVIVGAGTAGTVIALRLAEISRYRVLLLEAGPYAGLLSSVPAAGPLLQGTPLDWRYETVPQKHACRALENNVSLWPAGRLFGGSARFNNMMHVRARRDDYAEWYAGKTDYDYDADVLHYYRKAESAFAGSLAVVRNATFSTRLTRALRGLKRVRFSPPPLNARDGRRWTTADVLLERGFGDGLRVLTGVRVDRLLFADGGLRVDGVEFRRPAGDGEARVVRARKAVALCAGAVGSPKLLMLSGVGPANHLSSLGVRVVRDLPVGDNLQDHVLTGLDLFTLDERLSLDLDSVASPLAAYDYLANGRGPLTAAGCETTAFVSLGSGRDRPDLQIAALPLGLAADAGLRLRHALNVRDRVWDEYFRYLVGRQTVSLLPIVLHPASRGTVRLRDSRPESAPLVDPDYLSDPRDVDALIRGVRIVKRVAAGRRMRRLGARLYSRPFPGCAHHRFDSTPYWECYVRGLTLTMYHPVGTCKMGASSDRTAVVDFDFRVKNFTNLYVVDASVMPGLPSANTNAPAAALAERAADVIKHHDFLLERSSDVRNAFVRRRTTFR